jgi:hypothetical protein
MAWISLRRDTYSLWLGPPAWARPAPGIRQATARQSRRARSCDAAREASHDRTTRRMKGRASGMVMGLELALNSLRPGADEVAVYPSFPTYFEDISVEQCHRVRQGQVRGMSQAGLSGRTHAEDSRP